MHSDPSTQERTAPAHVAIIMDGNGRWAKFRGLPREEGHRQGVENVKKIVEAARDLNLRYLTLYAFSVENWKRPKFEINALMRLLDQFLKEQAKELVEKEIKFRVIGRFHELPENVVKRLRETIEATRHFSRWNLTLALNYGSRTEMLDAVRNYTEAVQSGQEQAENLNWENLARYFYDPTLPDPDLVIRTSGEHRISNFLLMQSAYSEYFFAPEYWPDFGPEAFQKAILDYSRRERRFGKTGDQIHTTTS